MTEKTSGVTPCLCSHPYKAGLTYLFQLKLVEHPGGQALDHGRNVSGSKETGQNMNIGAGSDRILQNAFSLS